MGLVGDILGFGTDIFNLNQQKYNLSWQKEAQKTTWQREDNAVQRRTADLKAAGLNPVLAAGSAAQSSAPIHTDAPQMGRVGEFDVLGALQMRQNIKAGQAEIARTNAETNRIKAEIDIAERKEKRDAEYHDAMMQYLGISKEKGILENQGIGLKNQFIAREKQAEIDRMVAQTEEMIIRNKYLRDHLEAELKIKGNEIDKETLTLKYLEEKLEQEETLRRVRITAENMYNLYMTTKGYKLKGETAEKMIRALDDDHAIAVIEKMIREQDWEVLETLGVHENMLKGFTGQAMSVGTLIGTNLADWIEGLVLKLKKRPPKSGGAN